MNEKEAKKILKKPTCETKGCVCTLVEKQISIMYLETIEKAKPLEEALLWCIRYFKEIDDKVKIDFIKEKLVQWEKGK